MPKAPIHPHWSRETRVADLSELQLRLSQKTRITNALIGVSIVLNALTLVVLLLS